ncbi:MAG: hypothetical protein LUP99_01300, partial [Methanomicrobiales archaeon]|nr:hypothetical protein [Methanomicrobiales archaeon]
AVPIISILLRSSGGWDFIRLLRRRSLISRSYGDTFHRDTRYRIAEMLLSIRSSNVLLDRVIPNLN